MKKLLYIIILLIPNLLFAQDFNGLLDSLISTKQLQNGAQFKINIKVDVPGIEMPDKLIEVDISPDGKTKVKGDGILFLPKKGIFGQYEELKNTPNQAIFLGNNSDTLSYKLVSLDPESDWITADIFFHKDQKRIHKLVITTRQYGTFRIRHRYMSDNWMPSESIIHFDVLPMELPLKFLGRSKKNEVQLDENSKVNGSITLQYFDIVLNAL